MCKREMKNKQHYYIQNEAFPKSLIDTKEFIPKHLKDDMACSWYVTADKMGFKDTNVYDEETYGQLVKLKQLDYLPNKLPNSIICYTNYKLEQ